MKYPRISWEIGWRGGVVCPPAPTPFFKQSRIPKRLKITRIDSKESIPPAYLALWEESIPGLLKIYKFGLGLFTEFKDDMNSFSSTSDTCFMVNTREKAWVY
jgi:hypothetical protein